jgi:uncharacterized membrane protein (DUF485 family)
MNDSYRVLWLVIFVLFSGLVACVAAWLTWRVRSSVAEAILAGGVAFVGAFYLTLATYNFMDPHNLQIVNLKVRGSHKRRCSTI